MTPRPSRPIGVASRLCALAIACYPRDPDRARDLRELCDDELEDARRRRGARGVIGSALRMSANLVASAAIARVRDTNRGRHAPSQRTHMVDSIGHELRQAVRSLRRVPGFTATAIVVLGLALGVNVAVFSVANALLWRPLTSVAPDRVVRLYLTVSGAPTPRLSWLDYDDYRQHHEAFADLAAVNLAQVVVDDGVRVDQGLAETVTGNYFRTLGIRTSIGRLLDDRDEHADVVVLSHRVWAERFNADPGAIGRTIRVAGRPMTIAGVAPPSFTGTFVAAPIALWMPLRDEVLPRGWRTDRERSVFQVIGRLAPGLSRVQAAARLDVIARGLEHANGPMANGVGAAIVPGTLLHGPQRRPVETIFALVVALASLVLLIASVNLANLTVSRATARRRDVAVRLALGAGRLRIVRQMFIEGLAVAIPAAVLGCLIAVWILPALVAIRAIPTLRFAIDLSPDVRVVGFVLMTTAVAAAIVGGLPAVPLMRAASQGVLKDTATALISGAPRNRLQTALVVAQLAASIVLLITASLIGRSFLRALDADLGFDPSRTVAVDLQVPATRYDAQSGARLLDRVVAAAHQLPGVVAVSLATRAPVDISTRAVEILVPGYESHQDRAFRTATYYAIGDEYFDLIRLPLVGGRAFTPADRDGSALVAIVNETFAHRFWPGQNPIGRAFVVSPDRSKPEERVTVVGVARDSKYVSVGEDPQPHVYLAARQHYSAGTALLVRTSAEDRRLPDSVQRLLRSIDPDLQGFFPRTLEQHVAVSLLPRRILAGLAGSLAALASLLALVGLYAVTASVVAQRTRELALRLALGAAPADLRRLILVYALRLCAWGTAIGLAASFAGTRVLSAFLFRLSPTDPVSFVAVPISLAATALAACYVPARRAMNLDPTIALREG